jgi:hypothetical protein
MVWWVGCKDERGEVVPLNKLKHLLDEYRKLNDIVTEIESMAFCDGHYLAVSFSADSFNSIYSDYTECNVLRELPCRFPPSTGPSMERAA